MSDFAESSVPLMLHDVDFKLETIVPSAIRTHAFEPKSPSIASTLRGLQDKKLSSPEDREHRLPSGWVKIKHQESGVYYFNEEKNLCTSSNVLNPKIYSLITQAVDILHRSSALQNLVEDQEVDLVIDSRLAQGAMRTTYYCVSHSERRIFWLEGIGHDQVDIPCPSSMCQESKGFKAHCVEAQYWKHCELFPTTFTVTYNVTGDLKHILLQAAADRLVAKFSTSPYTKEDLAYMLNVIKEIEDVREGISHSSWIIAKFMSLYNDGVLRSSYGQSDDYFDIDSTHSLAPYKRSYLLAILGPFFFKSPDVYAVELHSFHQNFTPARFSTFVHKVDQSIRDSNLLATVLLGTDMGLLAYSNDGKTGGITAPRPAQIVAYVSIICSVGSIITGLAIFKQYRAKGADTPLRAVIVLRRILEEPFGLERLAIICSLPYIMLMWSLIAFLAAIGIIFYDRTAIWVRVPVSVALFLGCLCLFFCMYTAGPPNKEEQRLQKQSRNNTPSSYLPRFDSSKGNS